MRLELVRCLLAVVHGKERPLPTSPLWEEFHTSREMSAFSYWQCIMFAAMIESSPLGELEGASSFVQLATPKAPARAVSTVITILRICFQFTFIVIRV